MLSRSLRLKYEGETINPSPIQSILQILISPLINLLNPRSIMSPNAIYSSSSNGPAKPPTTDLISTAIAHALSVTPNVQKLLTAVSRRDEIKPKIIIEQYEKIIRQDRADHAKEINRLRNDYKIPFCEEMEILRRDSRHREELESLKRENEETSNKQNERHAQELEAQNRAYQHIIEMLIYTQEDRITNELAALRSRINTLKTDNAKLYKENAKLTKHTEELEEKPSKPHNARLTNREHAMRITHRAEIDTMKANHDEQIKLLNIELANVDAHCQRQQMERNASFKKKNTTS